MGRGLARMLSALLGDSLLIILWTLLRARARRQRLDYLTLQAPSHIAIPAVRGNPGTPHSLAPISSQPALARRMTEEGHRAPYVFLRGNRMSPQLHTAGVQDDGVCDSVGPSRCRTVGQSRRTCLF